MQDQKPHILKRWFFWLWALLLVGFVLLTLSVDFDKDSIGAWFSNIADTPWAIPATVLIYTIASFASAPQWMLHGGAVLAFGPVQGAIVAWASSCVSASVHFWLGRRLGAKRVSRYGGEIMARFISAVRQFGFWASMIVRIVPTGPFILVNLAAGVSGMRFPAFFAGTGIGMLPKIIAIAFFGEGVKGAVSGRGPIYVGIVVGIAFVWMGVITLIGSRLSVKKPPENTP